MLPCKTLCNMIVNMLHYAMYTFSPLNIRGTAIPGEKVGAQGHLVV